MDYDKLYDYQYFRASKGFQKSPKRLGELKSPILSYGPKTVLDVGCGLGHLVRSLRKEDIDAYGVDMAAVLKNRIWGREPYFIHANAVNLPFPDDSFDLVFSSDFFEHVPENAINFVLSEMKRVGGKVLARVAYEDKLNEKQEMYHVTNKSKDWWERKLEGVELI